MVLLHLFLSLNPSVPIHYNCKQKTRKKAQHCFWINMRVSKWGQNFYFWMNNPFKWQYSLPSRYWKKLHYQFSTGIFSRISPWVLSDWKAAAVKHSCICMSSGSVAAHVNSLNAIFSQNAFPCKLHTGGYVLSKWKQTVQKTTFAHEHKVMPNGKDGHCTAGFITVWFSLFIYSFLESSCTW